MPAAVNSRSIVPTVGFKASMKRICPTPVWNAARAVWHPHTKPKGIRPSAVAATAAIADNFAPVTPWALPNKDDCVFYHFMSYPDGSHVDGAWDIRGDFSQYIGHFPIRGKSMLDVGTAGGFLAIEAEKAGARVTALDASDASEFERVPFANLPEAPRFPHDLVATHLREIVMRSRPFGEMGGNCA